MKFIVKIVILSFCFISIFGCSKKIECNSKETKQLVLEHLNKKLEVYSKQIHLYEVLVKGSSNVDSLINIFTKEGLRLENVREEIVGQKCNCEAELRIFITPRMRKRLQQMEGKESVIKSFEKKYKLKYSFQPDKNVVIYNFEKEDLVYTMAYYVTLKSVMIKDSHNSAVKQELVFRELNVRFSRRMFYLGRENSVRFPAPA